MKQTLTQFGRIGALLVAAGSVAAVAQGVQTGDLAGVVTDKNGAPVAGALLRLDSGRGEFTARSDAKGAYRFPLLIVGNAKLRITANGYVGATANVRISLGQTSVANFALKEIKEASATVEVVASAEVVDITAVTDGRNTSLDFVSELPINNRTIQNIAALTPGTSNDGNGLTIRGAQSTQTQWLVDGVDTMDPVTGGSSVMMNEDMIEEVQVVTGGATADLGRFTGGMVNTVTKSGTNEFEGVARWELTNPSWNAYNPLNRGTDGTYTFPNHTSTVQNYRASGPIWKDHLFFVVGYRTISPKQNTSYQTTADPAYGGGIPYFYTLTDERKDVKLDFQINSNHRISYQYNQTNRSRNGIDYGDQFFGGSTSTDSLSSQKDTFSYTSLGYYGNLASNLLLNAHYGYKKEQLGGPGSGGQGNPSAAPMVDVTTNYLFDNGVFGKDADYRPVENATVSMTWIAQSPFGEHEIKAGYDWFQSKRKASNSQSPTNSFVYFNGFASTDANGNPTSTAISNRVFDANSPETTYLDAWPTFEGAESKNRVDSIYINDKWKFNQFWSFNIGLRWDKFTSKNDLQAENFNAKTLSPRLTATYDVKGDSTWVVQASYDEYVGQVIQGATDNASVVGNPANYKYTYVAGDPEQRSSWSTTPFYVYDPSLYRASNRFNSNLKMPKTTEKQLVLRHNDADGGTYSLTLSKREWKNFVVNYQDLQANPVDGNDLMNTYYDNDPSIRRNYIGAEFQWNKRLSKTFSWGGNVTWSELKGNYEGGQAGSSGAIESFGPAGKYPAVFNAAGKQVTAYQPTTSQASPYGFLVADQPISARIWANYDLQLPKGTLSFAPYGTYASGAPYANTATVALTNWPNPTGTTNTSANDYGGALGSTYTRYFTARGAMRYPDTYNVHLQIGYEVPVWNKVRAFARLNVTNLFNHQLLIHWNTSGSAYVLDPSTKSYVKDLYNSPNAVFMAGSKYGKPTSSSNDYLAARTLNFAFGARF